MPLEVLRFIRINPMASGPKSRWADFDTRPVSAPSSTDAPSTHSGDAAARRHSSLTVPSAASVKVGVRRTNTPLQALTLLNDVTMLEASRVLADAALADAALADAGDSSQSTPVLQWIATRILSRKLSPDELKELQQVRSSALKTFRNDAVSAMAFLHRGATVGTFRRCMCRDRGLDDRVQLAPESR